MAHDARRLDGPLAFAASLSGLRLDATVTGILLWTIGGVVLDVRSHVEGFNFAEEGFLTLEHAVFYAGYLALAGVVVAASYRCARDGEPLRTAVPDGYRLGVVGLVLFALGGPADAVWHATFGAEANVEALVSPTHLLLATGGFLFGTAPLRATLARGGERGVRQLPALVSGFVGLTIVAVFSLYAQPAFFLPGATAGESAGHGVTSILWQSALVAGTVAYVTSRLRPVPGAFTLLVGGAGGVLAFIGGHPQFAVPYLVTGVAIDVAVGTGRATASRRRIVALATGGPALLVAAYVVALFSTVGVAWTVHLWVGAIYLAGCVGALVGVLATPGRRTR